MQTLTLTKTVTNIQLGHLYEHLFMRALNEFFYARGVFKYLDYAAQGSTFDEGYIVIEIDFYSDEALKLRDEIQHITLHPDNETQDITSALFQISAEEQFAIHITDKKKVVDELSNLANRDWQPLKDVELQDSRQLRKKNIPIYLTNEKTPKPLTLKVTIAVNDVFIRENHLLLPLFYIVSRVILYPVGDRISKNHSVYASELYTGNRRSETVSRFMAARELRQSLAINDVASTVRETIAHLYSSDATSKIINTVKAFDQTSASNAPLATSLISETGILVGTKGWNTLASSDKVDLLLSHMSLSIEIGRQKALIDISPRSST